MNKTDGSIVGCDIELKNGHTCGVQAIGRCATCERAFCLTHQAREWYNSGPVPYVDMCAPCLAKTPAKVAEAEAGAEKAKRGAEVSAAREYFKSGSARTALLNSGVPPVEIYHIHDKWKSGLFGLGGRYVEVATPIGRGWILGMFKWQYPVVTRVAGSGYGGDTKQVTGDCQTALIDVSEDCLAHLVPGFSEPKLSMSDRAGRAGLARVQPYSGGYEYIGHQSDRFEGGWMGDQSHRFEGGWIAAAKTVKRLVGASS